MKYKQEGQIDLAKSLEGSVKSIELQGAQNILLKQGEFDTPEGIKGMKGFGSFSKIDPISKTSIRFYYEILVFSQESGLQQIITFHQEDDQYAKKISDRIMNSVELKKGT